MSSKMTLPKHVNPFPGGASRVLSLTAAFLVAHCYVGFAARQVAGQVPEEAPRAAEGVKAAAAIFDRIGVARGLCVVLGDPECKVAIELARRNGLLVYVQGLEPPEAEAARRAADAAGLYGTRIYVEQGPTSRIHLADNLADAVVAAAAPQGRNGPAMSEILRVLRPGGKALVADREITKPLPEGMDDWSHPYHGPDNNPQSSDRLIRAPYLTKFLAEPWHGPQPQMTVVSGGRIFKAFGHRAIKRREWPLLNTLIAMNAYNGTLLWQRLLEPGYYLHRSVIIATPETLYLGGDASCKLIDAATGRLKAEIIPPKEVAGGPEWKWMALRSGILYALLGKKAPPEQTMRGESRVAGWPWWQASGDPWLGNTILAVDVKTRKVLWSHAEEDPLDSRAVCMNRESLFFYSDGKFLGCLDTKTGEIVWKSSEPEILAAIGEHHKPYMSFASSAFAACNDRALYFASGIRSKLVAVSASDGELLWTYPEGNFRLLLRKDALCAMGRDSHKFDLMTGEVLGRLPYWGNCVRPTGTPDSVFGRLMGMQRLDMTADPPRLRQYMTMRPACQDSVVVANGHLYLGPWMCDCPLTLLGTIALGSAGGFDIAQKATDEERLQVADDDAEQVEALTPTEKDWHTYRANNTRTASLPVAIPEKLVLKWQYRPIAPVVPTAPVTVGGLAFCGGSDGVVRALDSNTGKLRWKNYTGGPIHFPPSIWQGRAYVGSGDGWVYAFEAATGRLLWRFRAAPTERKISVYGLLTSNWPVASGVLVEDGVAYAAAGIANHDGTYVYALDAVTGRIKWQNNATGGLSGRRGRTGVSVCGHLLLGGEPRGLYLAGGSGVVSAAYDAATGRHINLPVKKETGPTRFHKPHPGRELFLLDTGEVVTAGDLLYLPKGDRSWRSDFIWAMLGDVMISRGLDEQRQAPIVRVEPESDKIKTLNPRAGVHDIKNRRSKISPDAIWTTKVFAGNLGLALGQNAVAAIGQHEAEKGSPPLFGLVLLDSTDGKKLWSETLPAPPVRWGAALDRHGRLIVTLSDGRMLCFGGE